LPEDRQRQGNQKTELQPEAYPDDQRLSRRRGERERERRRDQQRILTVKKANEGAGKETESGQSIKLRRRHGRSLAGAPNRMAAMPFGLSRQVTN
jgi:hypothetical protein